MAEAKNINHNHKDFQHYDDNVKIFSLSEGECKEIYIEHTDIAFIQKGSITISYKSCLNLEIDEKNILLFPPGSLLNLKANTDSYIIVCHSQVIVQSCDNFAQELLSKKQYGEKGCFGELPYREGTERFIESFLYPFIDGLQCSDYIDLKIKELFYLFRIYYSHEELASFLAPVLTADTYFSSSIWKNYRQAKTIDELSKLMNYSRSGFRDRFKKVFGISASQWLKEQKAQNIYHDLSSTNKSLKEISEEYNFCSTSHLNTFCITCFGAPPGKIRKTEKSQ